MVQFTLLGILHMLGLGDTLMLNQQEWSSELIPNTFPVSALSRVLKGSDMSLEEELLLSE
jgi:hypothetical protein